VAVDKACGFEWFPILILILFLVLVRLNDPWNVATSSICLGSNCSGYALSASRGNQTIAESDQQVLRPLYRTPITSRLFDKEPRLPYVWKIDFNMGYDRVIWGRVRQVPQSENILSCPPTSSKWWTQTWRLPAVRNIMAECQKQVKGAQSEYWSWS